MGCGASAAARPLGRPPPPAPSPPEPIEARRPPEPVGRSPAYDAVAGSALLSSIVSSLSLSHGHGTVPGADPVQGALHITAGLGSVSDPPSRLGLGGTVGSQSHSAVPRPAHVGSLSPSHVGSQSVGAPRRKGSTAAVAQRLARAGHATVGTTGGSTPGSTTGSFHRLATLTDYPERRRASKAMGAVDASGRIRWRRSGPLGETGRVVLGLNAITGDLMAVRVRPFVHPRGAGGAGGAGTLSESRGDGDLEAWRLALGPEIALCRSVRHRHVVRYLGVQEDVDAGTGRPAMHFFMELIPHATVAGMLTQFGRPLGLETSVRLTRQLLLAVVYLHEQRVVHGGICGAAVLVLQTGGGGHVKLGGMGGAVRLGDDAEAVTQSGTQSMTESLTQQSGTESMTESQSRWRAPEVRSGAPYSFSADVYSVGATLVEMLTCNPPVFADAASEALGRPTLPDSIPGEAVDLICSCLRHDASARPSAESLLWHSWLSHGLGNDSPESEGDVYDLFESLIPPELWPLGPPPAGGGGEAGGEGHTAPGRRRPSWAPRTNGEAGTAKAYSPRVAGPRLTADWAPVADKAG